MRIIQITMLIQMKNGFEIFVTKNLFHGSEGVCCGCSLEGCLTFIGAFLSCRDFVENCVKTK